MACKKPKISTPEIAKPHTIMKFILVEEYVKAWAQKLLNYSECDGIVFIDCMCNSGMYKSENGNDIFGTPVRVANYLSEVMIKYPNKKAWIYYNDLSELKVEALKRSLPISSDNFKIFTSSGDGNEFLKRITSILPKSLNVNYLLLYDPYTASIDWDAIMPYLQNWGEVIINHMVSDSVRGVTQAKNDMTIEKYEQTYMANINELVEFGKDRIAYEKRIQDIIATIKGSNNKKYYIASFPFFNRKNSIVYNLIHCTGNVKGFKLFKKTAWKTFGGKSSAKDLHGKQNQLIIDFTGKGELTTITDECCYFVKDIVKYLYTRFKGQSEVPLTELWKVLDEHPVFPSEGFKKDIKKGLKNTFKCRIAKSTITF